MNNSGKGNRESPLLTLLGIALLLMMTFMVLTVPISAEYPWMDTDISINRSTIRKPVDPILFNDENSTIQIDVGEEWVLKYDLKKGTKYHIFLVGDWIMNESNPITDYDILVSGPGMKPKWHTESAGLLEQVSNEKGYPYFEPEASGTYDFRIVNDERDSEGNQSAYFMLIEHIDVNEWYSIGLVGRDPDTQDEVLRSGWGYEFNTNSSKIKITVIVPDGDYTLDMYEARLYAMADPDNEIGYSLNGVGIPLEEYFEGFMGAWGGYSTSVGGDRNILAMDSAERSGVDLEIDYDAPTGAGGNVFYYLALIAEHYDDTVDFIIQTDFSPPELTLVDPPELVIEDDDAEIKVIIDDEADIERVWINYTTDGENWSNGEDLRSVVDGYEATLENYLAGDFVEYVIYAEDEFGNVGSTGSGFQVKRSATISCSIADMTLMGDQDAVITGVTNLESAPLHASFTNGDSVVNLDIDTGEDGAFSLTFNPTALGDWSFRASFGGDNVSFPGESNVLTFLASSQRTQISGALSDILVKKGQPLTVSGSVDPMVPGMQVDVTLVSATASISEKVSVADDGTYSFTFSPPETGIWNALSMYGDGFAYESSQSGVLEFEVVPLMIGDKILMMYLTVIRPPVVYGAVGIVGLGISSVVYVKRESIIKVLPGKRGKSIKKSSKKKKKNGKNGDRFRRSKK